MVRASNHNSLDVLKPHLAKEWHPTKNGNLSPRDVTPASGVKVWWICEKRHEWEAVIYSRTIGMGCPFCQNLEETDFEHLSLSKTALLKEWHPTKNKKLNPRDITSRYDKQLWWLCEKGHEWEATFKSRIKGDRCPVCVTELVKEQSNKVEDTLNLPKFKSHYDQGSERINAIFQVDSNKHYAGVEYRKTARYKYKATAMLEERGSGRLVYAQMQNISNGGMYFETNAALKRGAMLTIKFDKPLSFARKKIFPSTVIWCKGLEDDEGYIDSFGLGVKFT
jgi:hypothetical protein